MEIHPVAVRKTPDEKLILRLPHLFDLPRFRRIRYELPLEKRKLYVSKSRRGVAAQLCRYSRPVRLDATAAEDVA
jgi:hypothetical protein